MVSVRESPSAKVVSLPNKRTLVTSRGTSKVGTGEGMAVAGANGPVPACGVVVMTEVGAYWGRVVGVSVGMGVSVGEGVKVGVLEAVGLGPMVGESVSVGGAVSVGGTVGSFVGAGKRVAVCVGSRATTDKDGRVGDDCALEMKYLSQIAGSRKNPKIIKKTRPKTTDRFVFTIQIYTLRPWIVGELYDERR